MTVSNTVLNEYYRQTKGANVLLSSDDFWMGAWLGSRFGGSGSSDDGCDGCPSCLCLIIGCIGCLACFGGKFGVFLGGLWDLLCGLCSCNCDTFEEGCCTICCI